MTERGPAYRNFVSAIGYAASHDGIHFVRQSEPLISPDQTWDRYGCEDPRITRFSDTFYIFYTAMNAPAYTLGASRIGLATTEDFTRVRKRGVVGPPTHAKAAALFPEPVAGKIAMILTLEPDTPSSSIAVAFFDDLDQLLHPSASYWNHFLSSLDQHIVLPPPDGVYRGPEVGAPPLNTSEGWLLIYCGAAIGRVWSIDAVLLDPVDPRKVLRRSSGPILKPERSYETGGLTPNVTFPGGAMIVDEAVYVYYGAADTCVCLATCRVEDLLASLCEC